MSCRNNLKNIRQLHKIIFRKTAGLNVIIAAVLALQFKQLQILARKNISGLHRGSNPWPRVSAVVLFQLSYKDTNFFWAKSCNCLHCKMITSHFFCIPGVQINFISRFRHTARGQWGVTQMHCRRDNKSILQLL